MNAARLREAARVLRERAQAATTGEWSIVPGASNVLHFPDTGGARVVVPGNGSQGRQVRNDDARYIATMDPDLGLELADWLDTAGADEWAHGPHCLTPCEDCDDDQRAPHVRAALALADLILGDTK